MANYFGEDGVVYVKMHGEWEPIGHADSVEVEVDPDATEEEILEQVQGIAGEEGMVELNIAPDDFEAMYEYVYYSWLEHRFPFLHWN